MSRKLKYTYPILFGKCKNCDKEMWIKNSQANTKFDKKTRKFCNRSCRTSYRNKVDNPSWKKEVIEKIFQTKAKRYGFKRRVLTRDRLPSSLGRKKSEETKQRMKDSWTPQRKLEMSIRKRREKNCTWKNGNTPFSTLIRKSRKNKLWSKKIKEKDNYICQICGIRGGFLHSDHFPKAFAQILQEKKIQTFREAMACKELWSLGNGRTLCVPCHQKTDTYKRPRQKHVSVV